MRIANHHNGFLKELRCLAFVLLCGYSNSVSAINDNYAQVNQITESNEDSNLQKSVTNEVKSSKCNFKNMCTAKNIIGSVCAGIFITVAISSIVMYPIIREDKSNLEYLNEKFDYDNVVQQDYLDKAKLTIQEDQTIHDGLVTTYDQSFQNYKKFIYSKNYYHDMFAINYYNDHGTDIVNLLKSQSVTVNGILTTVGEVLDGNHGICNSNMHLSLSTNAIDSINNMLDKLTVPMSQQINHWMSSEYLVDNYKMTIQNQATGWANFAMQLSNSGVISDSVYSWMVLSKVPFLAEITSTDSGKYQTNPVNQVDVYDKQSPFTMYVLKTDLQRIDSRDVNIGILNAYLAVLQNIAVYFSSYKSAPNCYAYIINNHDDVFLFDIAMSSAQSFGFSFQNKQSFPDKLNYLPGQSQYIKYTKVNTFAALNALYQFDASVDSISANLISLSDVFEQLKISASQSSCVLINLNQIADLFMSVKIPGASVFQNLNYTYTGKYPVDNPLVTSLSITMTQSTAGIKRPVLSVNSTGLSTNVIRNGNIFVCSGSDINNTYNCDIVRLYNLIYTDVTSQLTYQNADNNLVIVGEDSDIHLILSGQTRCVANQEIASMEFTQLVTLSN
jgi:hypothetical protein